jgi:glycosyltransferase involved in cell wall biosynthesis
MTRESKYRTNLSSGKTDKIRLLIVAQHPVGGGAEKILYRLVLNLHHDFDIELVSLYSKQSYIGGNPALPGVGYSCLNAEQGNTFIFANRLRKIIKVKKPDKILSFTYYQNILTFLSLTGLSVPYILSERSNHRYYFNGSLKHRIWKWLLNKAYRKAAAIVTVSDESRKILSEDFNLEDEKLFTIYNGLSFSLLDKLKEEPVTDLDFEQGISFVVAVGNKSEAKNYPFLIKGFSIFHSKNKNTKLIIIGSGESDKKINELIRDLDLNDQVILTGYRDNPFKYMKLASCYVLSSRWEGFPNSLLEAMYINGHVISTNCPTGPSEIISHNVDGLLCEMDNQEELADAMGRMCFDEDFRERVFINSRKKISGFDEKIMIDKYRNLFLK